jgi:S-DNA-T family DNA segregation ATPase FtsK/SpoIIIE
MQATGAWLQLLRQAFGWGMALVPFVMVLVGLRLALRGYRDRLPQIGGEKLLALVVLYLLILAAVQAVVRGPDFARSLDQALQGRGGGLLGAFILEVMLRSVGGPGSVVVMLGLVLAAGMLLSGLSLAGFLTRMFQPVQRVAQRVGPVRAAGPSLPVRSPSIATDAPAPSVAFGQAQTPAESGASAAGTPSPGPSPEVAPSAPHPSWVLPDLAEILEPGAAGKADEEFERQRARLIEETLQAFGAPAHIVEVNRGPTITQFGVEPDFVEGRGRRTKVKVSKIAALADDLALALAAPSIRIEAPVPGKGFIGIEVPNTEISLVALRDVMEAKAFQKIHSGLAIGLGQDVSGHAIAGDLASMPHLLIAGTTGSGKSVCVNAIISCLLLGNTPDELRMLMVDPKRVELTAYNGIPHLLAPVVVDLERVVPALQWVLREMDERYRLFAKEGVRHLADYNQRMLAMNGRPKEYLVVVIDELADLMMLAPDETERVVTRLAQLARATGIHLVIATQRPSVDVVTGLIKANFPARIAFAVASSIDSRVILDQPGAERLLGRGDMLFQAPDAPAPVRMQGAFVAEAELARLIRYWKFAALEGEETAPHVALPAVAIPAGIPLKQATMWEDMEGEPSEDTDDLFDEAVTIVRQMRRASISLLQRRLRIGYTRAARLVDQLEEQGIIGPATPGSQPREVLDYGSLEAVTED